ncbi:phospholipid-binding protein MlaC [Henriciella sp.]|uniref:MlaC/ttg2D family ABC transporter substrate-binding protein n=1 Tax=Henriciella sp. TaxID=1968823 RepID=UPI00262F5781|nr:ABC transporter substrate-binding protein [Henriciella sp.]
MTPSFKYPLHRVRSHLAAGVLATGMALAFSSAAYAKASDEEATAVVTEAAERAVSALEDSSISDSEASQIIELVDVDRVAQFTLGNKWAELSDDQKTRYVEAFRVFAKSQLKEHLSGLSGAEVEVVKVTPRGETDKIVATRVTTSDNNNPQTLSWRLMDQGEWTIVDIQAQDVWFAIEQRAQFKTILDQNNGDIDALIDEISS